MIGFLRGAIAFKRAPWLGLDVNGVGYEMEAPMSTFYNLPEVGQTVTLQTHLAIREDAHALYAFATEAERILFRNLLKVSGVGGRMALAILSGLSVEEFQRCVHGQDIASLVRLPGVGKKTAERLIIEMRDRVPAPSEQSATNTGMTEPDVGSTTPQQEAISALIALGFKPAEAATLVKKVAGDEPRCEEIVRLALRATSNK